ncbi:hypothetical protein SK128_012218 [Halocaridina rubra]|uniref:Uncharacterized protein n=1 Tax=Halocaridina rubra TaxID=373956 RepID=A0AAN9A0L6_HALRR
MKWTVGLKRALDACGALENYYQSETGGEEDGVDCGEIVEQPRTAIQPTRPPPPRPAPSRPPPPRPTPPGSAPGSPATARIQAQRPKVMVITKPSRPAKVNIPSNVDPDLPIESEQRLPSEDKEIQQDIIEPKPPGETKSPRDGPIEICSDADTRTSPPTMSSIFGDAPPVPSSLPTTETQPFSSPFGAPPALPDNILSSDIQPVEQSSNSLFSAPPPQPEGLPESKDLPNSNDGEKRGPPDIPAPVLCPSASSGPPSVPPPTLPSNGSSGPPTGPPPALPTRSLPPVPCRTNTGPRPPVPSRNIPPVPARNLPPVPPRK